MGTVTNIPRAQFGVGDLVHHRLFDYRGGIVDVDPSFQSSDDWYLIGAILVAFLVVVIVVGLFQ